MRGLGAIGHRTGPGVSTTTAPEAVEAVKDTYARKAALEPIRISMNDILVKKALETSRMEHRDKFSRRDAEINEIATSLLPIEREPKIKPKLALRNVGERAARVAKRRSERRAELDEHLSLVLKPEHELDENVALFGISSQHRSWEWGEERKER